MEALISVENVRKKFGDKLVLNDLSFELYPGEILCLLGPNGAGKSTCINIIMGLLGFESGSVRYRGFDIQSNLNSFKKKLGIVPQEIALYEDLSAMENIRFFASLYNLKKGDLKKACQDALAAVGLQARADDRVSTFSGGMKRRLNIACAITHTPEILIMDEPTVGIDPQSRNYILDSIRHLRDEGMSILYTSHYMEEVESISSRIVVMDHGEVIAQGTKDALKQSYEDERVINIALDRTVAEDPANFYQIEGVKTVTIQDEWVHISSVRSIENLDRIIQTLNEKNYSIHSITTQTASLEMVFLDLTGRSLRD